MSWTITGEATKSLDATARSFADLGISGIEPKFRSMGRDTLIWTADTEDAAGTGTIIPDYGQVVELWWNSTRKFKGHVTGIRVGTRKIQVTVDGPWWWAEKIYLTSTQTDATGATAERANYVLATGDLKTHVESIIARAITNGVPWALGTVDAMFDVFRMTLQEQSIASALVTVMALVPDAVLWVDYAGTTPVVNLTRRGGAAAVSYTYGTDAIEIGDIVPRLDSQVSGTDLLYVTRQATTGLPAWAVQSSGTPAAGQRQIITVSGPEIADFLPADDFETVTVESTLWTALAFKSLDPDISAMAAEYGSFKSGASESYASNFTYYDGLSNSKVPVTVKLLPLALKAKSGASLPGGSLYFVTSSATLPEWAIASLGAVEVEISGNYLVVEQSGGWSPAFAAMREGVPNGGPTWINSLASDARLYYWFARPLKISGYAIGTAYGAPTAIYRPWDYDYLTPPAGMAEALVTAQNWLPWEGPITLVADEVSGDNLLVNKFNLENGLAACATMGALAKEVSHDIMRGRTTIELGAPPRLDFGTLVSRIRREPQDNIVYL